MSPKNLSILHFLAIFLLLCKAAYSSNTNFSCNGFTSANLTLDGVAQITPNGLLELTNRPTPAVGRAIYPDSIPFKPSSSASTGSALSFSTSFVFGIQSELPNNTCMGIVFFIAPEPAFPGSRPGHYMGLFNKSNMGNPSNHIFGVELDTIWTEEFDDINGNHMGIDINSLISKVSAPTSYFLNSSSYRNISLSDLSSGQPMRVWVDYNGTEMKTRVTIAPIDVEKPKIPLLTLGFDLSPVFKNNMYLGFSSATCSYTTYHYILAWSFALNGPAPEIDISKLPKLPLTIHRKVSRMITTGVPIIAIVFVATVVWSVVYIAHHRRKFAEEVDEWELDYGSHRFRYKDLYIATKGFTDKGLLGIGGFGQVYRGILPTSKIEIAVKKITHGSRQGMREFVAEIASLGRLRHRNLVQLLGYCRRKGELLLVYDYMPNGSLDKYIYSSRSNNHEALHLDWKQRFRIIKGVASGLLYLHEEWEQVVVHRDIKPSNVLLDSHFNGRLGDFGLARLYDNASDPETTTHVVGTMGYLAPEQTWLGKATRSTDVFGFGVFMLEVVCGRRPIDLKAKNEEESVLLKWVFRKWKNQELFSVVDPRLKGEFDNEEVGMMLKLGMMCSSLEPRLRPTIREVVEYLEGAAQPPDVKLSSSSRGVVFGGSWRVGGVVVGSEGGVTTGEYESGNHVVMMSCYPSPHANTLTHSLSIAESVLSSGR